jgi:hypothetical protein
MSTRLTPKQAAAIGVIIESNEGCAITLADNPSETRSVTSRLTTSRSPSSADVAR